MLAKRRYKTLLDELDALNNKVRDLLPNSHRLTEGEWRESVLRSVLRQHLPSQILPLRGFVTNGTISSRQIDILLFDSARPSLFRDGDLVIATPDTAAGIVEVKTAIRSIGELRAAIEPLAENVSMIRESGGARDVFAGLFAFETRLEGRRYLRPILNCLNEIQAGRPTRTVDMLSLGRSTFVLHWDGLPPNTESSVSEKSRWHAYNLVDQAPGYFLSNIIYTFDPQSVSQNMGIWFPEEPADFVGPVEQEDLGHGVAIHEEFKPDGGR